MEDHIQSSHFLNFHKEEKILIRFLQDNHIKACTELLDFMVEIDGRMHQAFAVMDADDILNIFDMSITTRFWVNPLLRNKLKLQFITAQLVDIDEYLPLLQFKIIEVITDRYGKSHIQSYQASKNDNPAIIAQHFIKTGSAPH